MIASLLLFWAFCDVESQMNPKAIGDGGKSLGVVQISSAVVKDVNRYLTKNNMSWFIFRDTDRFDKHKSFLIWRIYQEMWLAEPNAESVCKLWNGGPRWRTKSDNVQEKLTRYTQRVLTRWKIRKSGG